MLRLNLRKINQLIREAWAKGQAAAVSGRGPKSACYLWSQQVARDYFPDISPVYAAQVAEGKARLHWDAERREVVIVPTTKALVNEARANKDASPAVTSGMLDVKYGEKRETWVPSDTETREVEPAATPVATSWTSDKIPLFEPMLPLIRLRIERPDGRGSESEMAGEAVTIEMLDAAEDLRHTLTTGERPVVKNLYDLVAQAFSTTREDAKERLIAATYGMSSQRIEQQQRVSPIDRRRLAAGARAPTLPDPQGDFEARAQLEIIQAGMCALQSLDDLGEEGNRRARENLRELEEHYDALKASLQP
jgi:hypothetical protein